MNPVMIWPHKMWDLQNVHNLQMTVQFEIVHYKTSQNVLSSLLKHAIISCYKVHVYSL